jgi:hypothetical protein
VASPVVVQLGSTEPDGKLAWPRDQVVRQTSAARSVEKRTPLQPFSELAAIGQSRVVPGDAERQCGSEIGRKAAVLARPDGPGRRVVARAGRIALEVRLQSVLLPDHSLEGERILAGVVNEPREFGGPSAIEGGAELNGERLASGDAARVRGEHGIGITARETSELLLMEVQL